MSNDASAAEGRPGAGTLLAAQMESARAAEKTHRKLELDLAAYRGSELYRNTAPEPESVAIDAPAVVPEMSKNNPIAV